MVMIFMVYGKFAHVFKVEFPSAATANPRVEFQSLFAVSAFTFFLVAPGLGHNAVEFAVVRRFFFSA